MIADEKTQRIAKLEWREDRLRWIMDDLRRAGHPDIADDVCQVADDIADELRELDEQVELGIEAE